MEALFAIIAIIVVVGVIAAGKSIKTVQQYEDGIIFRFGRVLPGVRGPGLTLRGPALHVDQQAGELDMSIAQPVDDRDPVRVDRDELSAVVGVGDLPDFEGGPVPRTPGYQVQHPHVRDGVAGSDQQRRPPVIGENDPVYGYVPAGPDPALAAQYPRTYLTGGDEYRAIRQRCRVEDWQLARIRAGNLTRRLGIEAACSR